MEGLSLTKPFFAIDEALGTKVTLELARAGESGEMMLSYWREEKRATVNSAPATQSKLNGSVATSSGGRDCLEPLVLVCDSNNWTPDSDSRFSFSMLGSVDGGTGVWHQLRLHLAKPSDTDTRGNALPVTWQCFLGASITCILC